MLVFGDLQISSDPISPLLHQDAIGWMDGQEQSRIKQKGIKWNEYYYYRSYIDYDVENL